MNNIKNITFVTSCMGKGGAQRVISNLANYLSKYYNVTIIMILSNEISYDLNDNIKILDYSDKERNKLSLLPLWISKIRSYINNLDNKTSIIISFLVNINILVLIASIGKKVPIIVSERNDPKNDGRNIFVKLFTYILYPLSSKIVFQTDYAKNCFPKQVRNKGFIIENPIFVPDYNVAANREKTIISVGRLIKQKNHALLIKSFSNILADFPDYRLYIYGEGNLRSELTQLIDNLNIQESVFLPGKTDKLFDKIKDASLFVLSSDFEGQSNALLEAMALGIPSITTNCSGIDEVINGENGILVNTNDEDEMTNAIKYVLSNGSTQESLSKNAKNTLRKFELPNIIDKWKKMIVE